MTVDPFQQHAIRLGARPMPLAYGEVAEIPIYRPWWAKALGLLFVALCAIVAAILVTDGLRCVVAALGGFA